MTKILPLDKNVEMDKRYINQSEKLSEEALTQMIDNQAGGGVLTVKSLDIEDYVTKEEFAEALGITEEQVNNLFAGEYFALKLDVSSEHEEAYEFIPINLCSHHDDYGGHTEHEYIEAGYEIEYYMQNDVLKQKKKYYYIEHDFQDGYLAYYNN